MCRSIQTNKSVLYVVSVLFLALTLLLAAVPAPMAATYSTEVTVSVAPNATGLNHETLMSGTVTPAPPEGYFYQKLEFVFTRPDGTIETVGPCESDSNGTVSGSFLPNMIGVYVVTFRFSEQTINGNLYLASEAPLVEANVHETGVEVQNKDVTAPVASFTFKPNSPEIGVPIIFDASDSIDTEGSIVSYSWDFGDGTTKGGVIVPHSYTLDGSYTVVLTVADDAGFTANTTRTINGLVPKWSSIQQPSVPEFTLKSEAHPYDVAPTYLIDPFTGENVTTQEGYTVENKSIVVSIKNQPFASPTNDQAWVCTVNGASYYLVYNVRVKGHFGENWNTIYSSGYRSLGSLPAMSDSEYTVLSISAEDYPSGAQVDVQVVAEVWTNSLVVVYDGTWDLVGHYEMGKVTYGTSGWSDTQTLTIDLADSLVAPDEPTAPTEPTEPTEPTTPNDEADQNEQTAIILGLVTTAIVASLGTGLLVYFKIRKH